MNDTAATPATPTKKTVEPRHYKVRDRVTGDVIYVIGHNRNQIQSFAAFNRFDVTILTVREAIGLKDADVLDATAQPGPPTQLKLDVPAT